MASMRDIKRRRTSISSTQQITKAMKLVSTVKLQKAKTHAEESYPYFEWMYKTVCSLLAKAGPIDHPYIRANGSDRKGVITITSNRGLAGGYNSNIVKLITGGFDAAKTDVYAIGHKGAEGLSIRGYSVAQEWEEIMEAPTFKDAGMVCNMLLDKYVAGDLGEIWLAYTHFKNTVVHEPKLMKLLPIELTDEELAQSADSGLLMNFEPSEEETLELIVPKYVTSLIYGALVDAVASENGARMQAMDSATSNAEEMIDNLTLAYNRARQGSITQELTEIIAGAEAIS